MEENQNINYPDCESYPNLRQTWVLFWVFLIISIGLSFIYIILSYLVPGFSGNFSDYEKLFIYLITMSGTILYAKKASHSDEFDCGIVLKKSPALLFVLLIIVAPTMLVVVDAVVELIPMPEAIEQEFAKMVSVSLPSFLTVAVAAPIMEELLCRGIILRGLLKNMNPYPAILWSSFFFAALHLNPWQGIAAFTIGFVSGWVFWKTRSIIPSIFIHFLNNGISFLILFIAGKENSMLSLSELLADNYVLLLSLSLCICALGFYLINETLKSHKR